MPPAQLSATISAQPKAFEMRTSRISRDTKKILTSLSPSSTPTGSSARQARALRSFTHASPTAKYEPPSDSEPSPTSSGDESYTHSAFSNPNSRKRKRGSAPTRRNGTSTPSARVVTKSSSRVETSTAVPRKPSVRRQPAKKKTDASGAVKVEPPSDWEEVYALTMEMRKRVPAAVDTMGCDVLADKEASPRDQRFQTLVALMLSSQTKDTTTAATIRSMQTELPGGLTLESILAVEPERLNQLIGKVGFHNTKTKNIKLAAEVLRDKFNGDIPDTIEGLTSLKGVGPKMGYLCLSSAWGRDEGIGVDVHVHRITNLWGWHKTKNPEETRMALQDWLPREKWHEINWLLVGFGQSICLPVGRKCGECTLATKGLCPSTVGVKRVKREAKREVKLEDEEGSKVKIEETLEEEKVTELEEADDIKAGLDLEDFGSTKGRPKRPGQPRRPS